MINKQYILLAVLIAASVLAIPRGALARPAAPVSSPYLYNFNQNGTLIEAGAAGETSSPYWWLNSGGYMRFTDGEGRTNTGRLPATDPWRILYGQTSSVDTDNGYLPQNLFRLIGRGQWQNARQEAYFKISADNLTNSPNREGHNGILLFNRYLDGNNLYYTGIRVDGAAIIKKKKGGTYTTLRSVPGVFPGTYNRSSNPNLLPKNTWIGLRSEVRNQANGSVNIKVFMDRGWTGNWTLIAEATDQTNPITSAGSGGIRTDFMDVSFENYRMTNI